MSYVHGTVGGYTNHACRCVKCKEAARLYRRVWMARAQAAGREPVTHGSASSYTNYHCRCDECRAAWAAAVRLYRSKRRDAA